MTEVRRKMIPLNWQRKTTYLDFSFGLIKIVCQIETGACKVKIPFLNPSNVFILFFKLKIEELHYFIESNLHFISRKI